MVGPGVEPTVAGPSLAQASSTRREFQPASECQGRVAHFKMPTRSSGLQWLLRTRARAFGPPSESTRAGTGGIGTAVTTYYYQWHSEALSG